MELHQSVNDDTEVFYGAKSARIGKRAAQTSAIPLHWLTGVASVALITAAIWFATSTSSTQENKKPLERAIEDCWTKQQQPSFRLGNEGLRAETCERMEAAYRSKYGRY
jgi:hypothetical protein